MKKTYFAPEFEEIKISLQNTILAGSGGSNAGDDPEQRETDPDW